MYNSFRLITDLIFPCAGRHSLKQIGLSVDRKRLKGISNITRNYVHAHRLPKASTKSMFYKGIKHITNIMNENW